MATKEEIREELAKRRYYDGMVGIGSGIPKWEDRTEVEREYFRGKIKEDFWYLHSKGVVIRVDRELPTLAMHEPEESKQLTKGEVYGLCTVDMLKAGYSAVEPLIECSSQVCEYHIIKQQPLNSADTFEVSNVASDSRGYCGT